MGWVDYIKDAYISREKVIPKSLKKMLKVSQCLTF